MNLEKIELHGFKSFADKTTIEFKDGVTAIIGPNGCGKSNVADAIRWTLGEQSAKQLRGKNMQDVIFNGTTNRKSMSYSEVSIFFDNHDQRIFPKLAFDEVVITRKLDRSGLSEYLINGNRVRLKDVINLLHDTGIGKEGYSIIGQGRVQEIMSAKPEDRRQIFEEAAGISKFRAQKNEAERNLEKTAANLNTQNEIIAEIERQLTPLRRQAETAKKYFELKDQLKREEVNQYIYQYENNQSIKDNIKRRLGDIEKQLKSADLHYNDVLHKYDECFKRNGVIDEAYNSFNAELLTLKVDSAKIEGDVKLLQEKISNLHAEKKRLETELLDVDNNLAANAAAIRDAKLRLEQGTSEYELVRSKYEAKKEYLDSLSSTLAGSESDLEVKNLEYVRSLEELGSLKGQLSLFTSDKGINEERANNLSKLIDEKQAELDSDVTEKSVADSNRNRAIEEYNNLLTTRKETESERNEAEEAVKAIGEDLISLNSRLGTYETQLAFQNAIKNEYTGYQEAVKRLMTDAKNDVLLSQKVLGVLAEVVDVPPQYVSAIECALGGALQTVLVSNTNDANDLIAYLKQKNYGRITFRPLSSCREHTLLGTSRNVLRENGVVGIAADLVECKDMFRPFVNSFLGTTVVVDNGYTAAAMQRKYNFDFKIVTLDGDIFAKSGDITGGSRRGEHSGLLSQEQKIEEATKNLERTKKNIAALKVSREEREKDIIAATDKIAELSSQMTELSSAITLYTEKSKQCGERVETLRADVATDNVELEQVRATLADLNSKIDAINRIEESVNRNKKQYNDLFAQSKQKSGEQKSEREELLKEVMQLNASTAEAKSVIDAINAELFHLNNTAADLNDEKLDVQADLDTANGQINLIEAAPEKQSISPKDRARIADLEASIASLGEQRKDNSEQMTALEGEKNRIIDLRTDLSGKKIREESMLERADQDMIQMQEHILEDYDLSYAGCAEFRDEAFEINGAKTRISELKKSISRLGDVNPLALQTLEETEERYNTNLEQRDDIQKAYDDIVKIIEELTGEMKTKFMAAFEQISENFQNIFVQLFGGGRGELKLNMDNTDDVLEAGIDILAVPNGKKLQNMALLSGGEQTLTAIAILFAILSLKSMPFCILDEIEAALDDSNANLFAEFLKKFSERTQFIVITHRKPTMSHADSIFGVTMEERGVTKIVSIEFEEAVKYAEDDK